MTYHTTSIGLVVIFGIVLVPFYAMLVGWFLGEPSDTRRAALGVGYIVGIVGMVIVSLWIVQTLISLVV